VHAPLAIPAAAVHTSKPVQQKGPAEHMVHPAVLQLVELENEPWLQGSGTLAAYLQQRLHAVKW
jgi:hypothetical protein